MPALDENGHKTLSDPFLPRFYKIPKFLAANLMDEKANEAAKGKSDSDYDIFHGKSHDSEQDKIDDGYTPKIDPEKIKNRDKMIAGEVFAYMLVHASLEQTKLVFGTLPPIMLQYMRERGGPNYMDRAPVFYKQLHGLPKTFPNNEEPTIYKDKDFKSIIAAFK